MKGVIWKYYPKVGDPKLKDEMGRVGCVVANPDPDFWENPFPIWAICGPYVRSTLEKEDALFFTPVLSRSRAEGLSDYICSGYLTVDEVLPSKTDLQTHPEITPMYKRNYRSDLSAHEREDKQRTKTLRSKNIVVGDAKRSHWYGRNGQPLSGVLKRAGVRRVELSARRPRNLTANEAVALRDALPP